MNLNLKIARLKKGLSQDDVCRLSGIGRTTLSKLENGEGDPKLSVMLKLSGVLEISIEELFFSKEE